MRILQINSAKNFGGGERHLVDLCRGLTTQGHEVFVALRAENKWQEKLSYLRRENILYLPLKNSFDVFSGRKMAKVAREKNIEILHAHLARDYPVAAIAARTSKAKLVLTRHLLFPLNFSHKFILPKDATFIAVASGIRRQLLRQKIVPPEHIRLVYNGVDAKHFANIHNTTEKEDFRRRLNLKSDSLLVGIVGEITAHKGQTDFVRAASVVLKVFPDAEFLIAGQDGSPQKKHQKHLENLIEELNLTGKIKLCGWLEDVALALAALDVFVSASRIEPFGLAIVEAMAIGCPVVATETVGAREIIEDDITGKLVSIENPAELAETIIKLLNDENLRQTLGKTAQKVAADKFSIEKMVAATEKVYREILHSKT